MNDEVQVIFRPIEDGNPFSEHGALGVKPYYKWMKIRKNPNEMPPPEYVAGFLMALKNNEPTYDGEDIWCMNCSVMPCPYKHELYDDYDDEETND